MVRIPNIKIPSVRVGSIVPTSNIRTGGAKPAPPTPITYLTQWKLVGNSEVHGNEIWSCGEYSAVDGKYHILVQPLGGSIADIALDEPLRKVNDVADKIEFANGIAVVTRAYKKLDWVQCSIKKNTTSSGYKYFSIDAGDIYYQTMNILSSLYDVYSINVSVANFNGLGVGCGGNESYPILRIVNNEMEDYTTEEFRAANANVDIIYELATPTTEVIQVPQIEEADSYSCVISQGGKAVVWSSFETE